jgi:hypothetical protein
MLRFENMHIAGTFRKGVLRTDSILNSLMWGT